MTSRYRVTIIKVLEDGTEIEMVRAYDPAWFVSPMLKEFAKKIYEPAPVRNIRGQVEIWGGTHAEAA